MTGVYTYKLFTFRKFHSKFGTADYPHQRSGHRIVCDEANLYSYGGYHPGNVHLPWDEVWPQSKPMFKEIWKYNFASKEWKKLISNENMPNELISIAAILLPGRVMLIYGGTGVPFGVTCSNRLYMCNLCDDLQLVNVEGQLPRMLYGQAMVLDTNGRYLYVVGGTTGFEYYADIHRFDIASKTWEEVYLCTGNKPLEPQGRYRHELAFANQKIYILGGGTATTVFGFENIPVFNIDTQLWGQAVARPDPLVTPGFPAPRRCHSAVQIDDFSKKDCHVVICGGFNGIEVFSDAWRLELSTLQWKRLQSKLIRPVYFHSASVTPAGKMYVFGGIQKLRTGSERRTNEVDCMWLCVPSLSDMCWEAIRHYIPKLHLFPKNQLLMHGIPQKYVNQIEL